MEKSLTIFEDPIKKEFNIKGAIEEFISNYDEAIDVLKQGE